MFDFESKISDEKVRDYISKTYAHHYLSAISKMSSSNVLGSDGKIDESVFVSSLNELTDLEKIALSFVDADVLERDVADFKNSRSR